MMSWTCELGSGPGSIESPNLCHVSAHKSTVLQRPLNYWTVRNHQCKC